jgi:short-subunit dehydrogenase
MTLAARVADGVRSPRPETLMNTSGKTGTLLAELGLVSPIGKEGSYPMTRKPFAIVTGASSGIGYELAKCCAIDGFDVLVAADNDDLDGAAAVFRECGATVDAVKVDLATRAGVDTLFAEIKGRDVDALLANAGHGLGRAFLEQNFDDVLHVINTNITGTVDLVQRVGRLMQARGAGRILMTGSIAGFMPGTYQAVYNGTKAFIDSFAFALRNELKGTEVTVTCLLPGPTDTEFFVRADMLDTRVGQMHKADPAKVARIGFDAMLRGEADVVAGWMNKVEAVASKVAPAKVVAKVHRKLAEPKGQT